MKILHIVPTYIPARRYGGPIESVHNLNAALVKKGVEVIVYTTNIDGPNDLNVPTDAPVVKDGVKIFYFKSSFPRFWFYSKKLRQALAETVKDFDLIHITSVFLSVSTLGAYYAKKFKKPYIISPRGSLMKSPLASENIFKKLKKRIYISLIEKRNLEKASAIHFTTEAEKEEYLKTNPPLRKTIVIPNGFDIEEFNTITRDSIEFRKRFGITADKKIILFLSRLTWIKGLDTLVPAFAEVVKKEPKAVLVLAGPDDENYKKEIESKIENCKLKINNEVVFTGMLKGDDKIAAFQDSDVFVLPSYSESFGMAVIEAMCFGLPVVITKGVGISKEVELAGAGIVIKKDEKQLSEAILKVLGNSKLAKKIGENGKKLVKKEFSPEKVAGQMIKEYNDLIR